MTFVALPKEFGFDPIRSCGRKSSTVHRSGGGAGGLDPLILMGAAPACLVARNGCCVLLNEALAEMLRLPVSQVECRPIMDFFPLAGPILDRWFALADAGAALPDRHFTWGKQHYQVSARWVRSHAFGFDGLSLTAFDVTRHVRFVLRMRTSHRRLATLVHLDDLTGLLNRRGLEWHLRRELRRASRKQQPLSLLMIDIDHFKAYNDNCGHLEGDACLRQVSAVLQRSLRRSGDIAGRFGGEEFVILLPDAGESGAILVAERLRAGVESLWLQHPAIPAGHVTISVGVASLRVEQNSSPADYGRAAALMQAADAALYEAKVAGRNRVESRPVELNETASE